MDLLMESINRMFMDTKFKNPKSEIKYKTDLAKQIRRLMELQDKDHRTNRELNEMKKIQKNLRSAIYKSMTPEEAKRFSQEVEWGRNPDKMLDRSIEGLLRASRAENTKTQSNRGDFVKGLKVSVNQQEAIQNLQGQQQNQLNRTQQSQGNEK